MTKISFPDGLWWCSTYNKFAGVMDQLNKANLLLVKAFLLYFHKNLFGKEGKWQIFL